MNPEPGLPGVLCSLLTVQAGIFLGDFCSIPLEDELVKELGAVPLPLPCSWAGERSAEGENSRQRLNSPSPTKPVHGSC